VINSALARPAQDPEYRRSVDAFTPAEAGLNSILEAQDAFFASRTTKQPSGHPDAKQADKIRVEVNRGGNPSKFAPWASWWI
jgi:hypothetical protein